MLCRPHGSCCFSRGDSDLDRMKRDEIFRVLQKCAAEMSVAHSEALPPESCAGRLWDYLKCDPAVRFLVASLPG
jgi:hypothetical protein